jgi:hypothetical protein
VDVEEHRARRVADVGDVLTSAGELPDQPAVDGAEGQLSGLGARPGAGHVVEDPANLAGREIRIDQQAGFLLHQRPGAVGLQPLTEIGGAAVLPDHRVINRVAGFAIPDQSRLALIGDADGGEVAGLESGAAERFDRDANLRGPYLLRIVLHPTGLGEQLGELFLGRRHDPAVVIEHDRTRAGGALIEGENVGHRARVYNDRRFKEA